MEIYVLSRSKFDLLLKNHSITDETVETWPNSFFISILTTLPVPSGNFHKPFFNKTHSNVLTLTFDDVVTDTEQAVYLTGDPDEPTMIQTGKRITYEQGEELVNFIKENLNKKQAFIHCAAGISRSGAIGSFINDITGGTYEEFMKINPQVHENRIVLSMLKELYYAEEKNNTLG